MSDGWPHHHLSFTPPAPTLLGRKLLEIDTEAGLARMRFFARPEFTNRHGSVQGGFVSAMLDSATSVALLATLPEHLTSVTMKLETTFLRPTPIGELFAEARVLERTDREAVTSGELKGADGALYATARAVLRIRPKT
jgi:uncharacterized protein (TIGR00369 family)